MRIHIIIEIDGGKPVKITQSAEADEAPNENPSKKNRVADIAPTVPAPIPSEPAPDKPPVTRPGAGPQFDPGFLAIVEKAPQPFTRRAIAVASGVEVGNVTLRINRMHRKGWLEQPAPGLWQRTKLFGVKA
jgi:hypothetical protein